MKTLRDAKIGETVKVVKLHGEGAIKRRIMDMARMCTCARSHRSVIRLRSRCAGTN